MFSEETKLKSLENNVPYRVHLVPVVGPTIETEKWACPKCEDIYECHASAVRCCAIKSDLPFVATNGWWQDANGNWHP